MNIFLKHMTHAYIITVFLVILCFACSNGKTPSKQPDTQKQNNQEIAAVPPSVPPQTPQKDITTTPALIKYGLNPGDHTTLQMHKGKLSELASLTWLKAKKVDLFSFRLDQEATQKKAELLAQDFLDCGFSFDGPSCHEQQKKSLKSQVRLTLNDQEFLYTQFVYSETFTQPFALFIPIVANNSHTSQENPIAYLYLVSDPSLSHDPMNLLTEKSGLCIARLEFKAFGLNELAKEPVSGATLREKLSATLTKLKAAQITKSISALNNALEESKIIVAQTTTEVQESDDPQVSYLWLSIKQVIMPLDQYLSYLARVIEEQKDPELTREASLILLSLGANNGSAQKEYELALLNESSPSQRRALILAENKISITESLLFNLIKILNFEDIEVATMAFNILNEEDHLDTRFTAELAKHIHRLGRNGQDYIFGLKLLSKINSPEAHNDIIAELSNKNADIRNLIQRTITSLAVGPESAKAARKELSSPYPGSAIIAGELLDKINSPEATLYLLKFLENAMSLQRTQILGILMSPKKQYTDEHLPDLHRYISLKDTSIRRASINFLFKLGTELGLNELLTFVYNDSFGDLTDLEFRNSFLASLKVARIYPLNAVLLGNAFALSDQEIKDTLLDHLTNLQHFTATSVLVTKIWPLNSFIMPYLPRILANLKDRHHSDLHLFDGDTPLNLRYAIHDILSYLVTLKASLKDPKKKAENEAKLETLPLTNEILALANQFLLPLRSEKALEAMIELSDYPDPTLRAQYIAAVRDFPRIPREFENLFRYHLVKEKPESGSSTNIPKNSIGQLLLYGPSSYLETRQLAWDMLDWIVKNTASEKREAEIASNTDFILSSICNIIVMDLKDKYKKPELTHVVIDEAYSFIDGYLASTPRELVPERVFEKFRNIIASRSKTRCETIVAPENFYRYFYSMDILAKYGDITIATWFRDFLADCPQYPQNNPEIAEVLNLMIEDIEKAN